MMLSSLRTRLIHRAAIQRASLLSCHSSQCTAEYMGCIVNQVRLINLFEVSSAQEVVLMPNQCSR